MRGVGRSGAAGALAAMASLFEEPADTLEHRTRAVT